MKCWTFCFGRTGGQTPGALASIPAPKGELMAPPCYPRPNCITIQRLSLGVHMFVGHSAGTAILK
jgi:hypothetical protein